MQNIRRTVYVLISLIIGFFLLLIVPAITTSLGSASSFGTTPQTAISCAPVPTQTLKEGQSGIAVKDLQKILNIWSDTQIAFIGLGSPGNETELFGALTKAAVVRFQNEYAPEILVPNHLTYGTGFVGPSTLTELATLCSGDSATQSSQSASTNTTNPAAADPASSVNQTTTISSSQAVVISTPSVSSGTNSNSSTNTNTQGGSQTGKGSKGQNNTGAGSSGGSSGSSSSGPSIVSGPSASSSSGLQWGAYVGDASGALLAFESLVGKKTQLVATFDGWSDSFPSNLSSTVGAQGKTLVIFWEPNFGYSTIVGGSEDSYIQQFASDAKAYGYPVILVPFDEMNLNENAWGYGANGNTAALFQQAWVHVHGMFSADGNVKFAIDYNNVSVPNVSGNQFNDYYPGSQYVDYIALDGFNFGNPWQTFGQVFDSAVSSAQTYGKPIYILSTASAEGPQKAAWITDAFGSHIETYANVAGWIWFNQDDSTIPSTGDTINWKVDSDPASLAAFQAIIP